LLILATLVLLATLGCAGGVRGQWSYGRTLVMNLAQIQKVTQVAYQHEDRHFVVQPKDPGNVLAAVQLTLVNQKSARMMVLADANAALLEDDKGNTYQPLNPWEQRREVAKAEGNERLFVPFLWGNFEIPKDYELKGWMLFEVPRDIKFSLFRWEQADSLLVRF
jgi:hypothetical protein